jgi:hypothetical protein
LLTPPPHRFLDSRCAAGYDATIMPVLIFAKDLFLATAGQIASVFLGMLVFGLIIHFISQLTFKSLGNSMGPGGTYLVAWLGTPIHELGHAIFCIIFGHKIAEIRFFKPDKESGTLGYVYHTWNPRNPWHILGNFFIGVGPIVIGCGVLFGLFYFLIPNSSAAWNTIIHNVSSIAKGSPISGYFTVFKDSALSIIQTIFRWSNLTRWQFWLFAYLSICVSSNIRLSWADVKGSLKGLGCIVLPFLILNFILLLAHRTTDYVFPYTASVLGGAYSLLILALIMALAGFIVIYLLTATYYRLRYKLFLNPFK